MIGRENFKLKRKINEKKRITRKKSLWQVSNWSTINNSSPVYLQRLKKKTKLPIKSGHIKFRTITEKSTEYYFEYQFRTNQFLKETDKRSHVFTIKELIDLIFYAKKSFNSCPLFIVPRSRLAILRKDTCW